MSRYAILLSQNFRCKYHSSFVILVKRWMFEGLSLVHHIFCVWTVQMSNKYIWMHQCERVTWTLSPTPLKRTVGDDYCKWYLHLFYPMENLRMQVPTISVKRSQILVFYIKVYIVQSFLMCSTRRLQFPSNLPYADEYIDPLRVSIYSLIYNHFFGASSNSFAETLCFQILSTFPQMYQQLLICIRDWSFPNMVAYTVWWSIPIKHSSAFVWKTGNRVELLVHFALLYFACGIS